MIIGGLMIAMVMLFGIGSIYFTIKRGQNVKSEHQD